MKYTKFGQTLQQNMWIPSFGNLFLGDVPFNIGRHPKNMILNWGIPSIGYSVSHHTETFPVCAHQPDR